MGCDIHVHTEKLIPNFDGTYRWANADYFTINPYRGKADEADIEIIYPYEERDYGLFGILAGVKTYSDKQIDEPRGLPDNISTETKAIFDGCEDYHTPTYFTLKELLDYEKKYKKVNVWMTDDDYIEFIQLDKDPTVLDDLNVVYENPKMHGFKRRKINMLYSGYKTFLRAIKYRARDVLDHRHIFSKKTLYKDYADKFRVIIWFDN